MPIFDAYLMVDWSANSKPKIGKDSIWAAWLHRGGEFEVRNLSTRKEAVEFALERLLPAYRDEVRTLVGFDFAYAYPKGLAAALGRTLQEVRAPWRYVWDQIADAVGDAALPRNANDRFRAAAELNKKIGDPASPGPFWARPLSKTPHEALLMTRPTFPYPFGPKGERQLQSRRITEGKLSGAQETWKLFTAGSVGSQSLLGIPVVRGLRDDVRLRNRSQIWPFETGFTPDPTRGSDELVIHAEIWPGVLGKIDDSVDCRDKVQVTLLTKKLAALDEAKSLGSWFDVPQGLNQEQQEICLNEEGWILGAGAQIKAAA